MGYVYLIEEQRPNSAVYKIGITKNKVEKGRLGNLQTGNSDELYVVNVFECEHYFKLEGMLHRKYNGLNKRGEWFNLKDEEVLTFTETCTYLYGIITNLLENNPFYN